MDLEGSVRVKVDWDGCRIGAVDVRSTRSDVAQALVAGRCAAEARVLLPRVFSICARAQAAAAAAALDAARGAAERDPRHDEMAVLAEVALEYLWRLQIDLPKLLGLPQRTDALVRLRRALSPEGVAHDWSSFVDALQAEIEDECTGVVDHTDPATLAEWEGDASAPAARLLRALRAVPLASGRTALLPRLTEPLLREIGSALGSEPDFSRRPAHAGAPAECGARARLAAHPLLNAPSANTSSAYRRILARYVELGCMPERLRAWLDGDVLPPSVQSVTLAAGHGIAGVETARGLLVHAVTLTGDRVSTYRIVAPTEWNFHPQGALPADLADVPAGTRADVEQRAALAIQSLDPCVRYTLEVERRTHA
jgi:hypothetical protein